jgi:small GTP-binding protein
VNLHGGPWVVRSAIDLARRNGFEIIETPMFHSALPSAVTGTPAQDLNELLLDGTHVFEKEVEAHLPLARTELGLRSILRQPAAWEHFCKGQPGANEIAKVLDDHSLRHLLHPPAVAIVGAPNVGKSTLANQLFGQERSIAADVPGTTRDWVGEIANIDGVPVMLLDTPGQRDTHDAIERAAIERSRPRIDSSQLVVLVLDASRPLAAEQSELMRRYPAALRIANKCDRPAVWDSASLGALRTVANTGAGVDELRSAIAEYFGCLRRTLEPAPGANWWTDRQRAILARAIDRPQALAEIWTN